MERSSDTPRFEKDAYMRNFKMINFVMNAYFEVNVLNPENITKVPALFVANHIKFADTPLIAAAYTKETNKPIRAVAQKEYGEGKGIRIRGNFRILGAPLKHLVDSTHMLLANRDGNRDDFMQLGDDMTDTFTAGESVLVHADGTRSDNGMVNKFHTGVIRIGMDNLVPLVPTAVWYEGSSTLHFAKANISFGEPIKPSEYNHGFIRALPRARRVQHMTNRLEEEVASMASMKRSGEFMQTIRTNQAK